MWMELLEYQENSERQTKTRTGAEPRNVRAVKPKAVSFANGSPDRDPVFVYKVYSDKRPSLIKDSDSPFYLGINYTKNPTEKPWFKASAMGVNKLNSLMKTMADKEGFDEKRRLTNHSAQKNYDTKMEWQQHSTNSYNAITWSQKRPKRQQLQLKLGNIRD